MQKQKGFTIVELIIIVIIVTVLAAILMINVKNYIAQQKDVLIRDNLEMVTNSAAKYYNAISNYTNVCTDVSYGFKTFHDAVAAISRAVSCADTENKWCACAQLVSDKAKYFCVDYIGTKKETLIACATDCVDGFDYVCDGL